MEPFAAFLLVFLCLFVGLVAGLPLVQTGGTTAQDADPAPHTQQGPAATTTDTNPTPPTVEEVLGTAVNTGATGPAIATDPDSDDVDPVATALAATAGEGVPFDDPLALHRNGWRRAASEQSELYTGEFEADGTIRTGVIERKPSGRVKVYVRDPPRRMRRNAHNGRCLRDPSHTELDPGDGWREVHFSRDPETLTDSIEYVQTLME